MKEGDVVVAPLPQARGPVKNRPAIVLRAMPPYGDFLLCGVSSQVRHEVAGFDDLIGPDALDFPASGLKAPSLVRLGFLGRLRFPNCFVLLGRQTPPPAWLPIENAPGRRVGMHPLFAASGYPSLRPTLRCYGKRWNCF